MTKQISKKVAKEKYGVAVMPHHDYKYYLLDNGDVIDSAGDIRYINDIKGYKINKLMTSKGHAGRNIIK